MERHSLREARAGEHCGDEALIAFVAEFSEVEDALNDSETAAQAIEALRRSSSVFSEHAMCLESVGMAVYDTASEIFLEFRRRALEQIAMI